jgi:hypothetical protein
MHLETKQLDQRLIPGGQRTVQRFLGIMIDATSAPMSQARGSVRPRKNRLRTTSRDFRIPQQGHAGNP